MTLVELLLAASIMAMIAGVMGALASAVQTGSRYSQGHGLAAQHARVAFERISRAVSEAHATADYPGVVSAYETVGTWRFPDTLVVWHPVGAPVNPTGPPLVKELIIYCPDPDRPNRLLEITIPNDSRPAPLNEELNGTWRSQLQLLKRSPDAKRVVLTDLVRTALPDKGAARRGAVRFERSLQPSASAWAAYRAGTTTWNNLAWPQGLYGENVGTRQAWVRIELQLMPGADAVAADSSGEQAIVFPGSAALYTQLPR